MSSLALFSCSGSEARHFGEEAALNPRLERQTDDLFWFRKRRETRGEDPRPLREKEVEEEEEEGGGEERESLVAVALAAEGRRREEAEAAVTAEVAMGEGEKEDLESEKVEAVASERGSAIYYSV